MNKKAFWSFILLLLIFGAWMAAGLIARRSENLSKIKGVITENGGIKSGQPAAPAQVSQNSDQAEKPAEARPAKKISTKDIKDLKTALATGLPVVLEMGSDSCYPCKLIRPIFKELAVEQDGKIVFLALEIDEHQDLAREFRIRLIPAIIFYDKHGRAKSVHEGYLDKKQLLEWIDYLGLER